MIKEFEINDILNAVDSIFKIEKKKIKTVEKKINLEECYIYRINNQYQIIFFDFKQMTFKSFADLLILSLKGMN